MAWASFALAALVALLPAAWAQSYTMCSSSGSSLYSSGACGREGGGPGRFSPTDPSITHFPLSPPLPVFPPPSPSSLLQ
jgi:hypothetical protein